MFIKSIRGYATVAAALSVAILFSGCSLIHPSHDGSAPPKKHSHAQPQAEVIPDTPPTPAAIVPVGNAQFASPSSRSKPEEAKPAETTAASASASMPTDTVYRIQPGDVLTISVWKEVDLQTEVVVRPDGGISMPLADDLPAAGRTVEEVRDSITERLRRYIADPVVTVAIKLTNGNRIYVVGKVNRPGDFPLAGDIDVMQAIGLAGGATPFASLNKIRVLRHEGGKQIALKFHYYDVQSGHALDQNILLRSGDTVVVP